MKRMEPDDSLPDRVKAIERRGLPDDFKAAIINELYRDSPEVVALKPWWMPPRWLGAGIAACWIAILSLQISTPKDSQALASREIEIKPTQKQSESRRELFAALNQGSER